MDMPRSTKTTIGELGYLKPADAKPFNYMYEPPPGIPRDNCEYERCAMPIRDARAVSSALGLERSGFELLERPSALDDFQDEQRIREHYYRELEELALELTGGLRAQVFDHQLRVREPGRPALSFGRPGDGSKPTALGRVHNDYTEASGRRRLRQVLPDAPDDRPFLILNFWRPVLNPAIDTPLAVCDARSFPRQDWIATDIIYRERTGEIYLARHNEDHAWYYYPAMRPDEMLVFKSFDSRLDCPVRMTPHCAFDDPTAPPDAPLRRSIEARCLVILE